ncbi:MAG: diaminopimelate epimerase [Thermaerobacterales bacterium]
MTSFVKSHGLGNDYIVLDGRDLGFPLKEDAVRLICDRHFGVGSDGILLSVPAEKADFGVRIFNPDGSEAEKSGNGLRILAHYLFRHGHAEGREFTVETAGGTVTCRILGTGDAVEGVSVDMGKATFSSGAIPAAGPDREVIDEAVYVDGEQIKVTAVNVGNPHCVVLVEAVDDAEVRRLGPKLENHTLFPRRTNVQLVEVRDRGHIVIGIWERGAGYTLASGSSSCAAAAACRRLGLVDDHVTVEMAGGNLDITINDQWEIVLTGPVEEVCHGKLSDDLMRRLT